MVPQQWIEHWFNPYHGFVIPLYYSGVTKLYKIIFIYASEGL